MALCCIFFLPGILLAAPCLAAEINLSSRTYLLYYEREVAGTGDQRFAPLYEYLSGDANALGGRPLSFHFYGWGRIDLADDTDDDGRGGDLASAYLQYRHPAGNAEMRLGRFFLSEGTAAEILDGIFVKGRTPLGLGLSAFGGIPVERSITSTDTGDSIYGGRLFFAQAGMAEIGVSYLVEKGEFQGDDRELAGGDIWIRPGIPVELSGRAAYNVSTSGLASQRYVLRLLPFTRVDLSAGYEEYRYRDLFQTALHPAFLSPALDNTDEVQVLFAVADIRVAEGLTVEVGGKGIRHDRSNPGDATRVELGVRYAFRDRKDVAGLSAAVVSADRAENEYQEYRAFATCSPGPWRFTLDALTHRYKEQTVRIRDAYQVVGSAGWQALPYLRLSGDVTYTRSPRFTEDYAGLVRLSLDLSATTGTGGGAAPGGTKEKGPPAVPATPSPASGDKGALKEEEAAKPTVPTTTPQPTETKQPVPVSPPMRQEEKPAVAAAPPATAVVEPAPADLDRMAAEIRKTFPKSVVKRRDAELDFTLPSDLVFDVGSEEVNPSARRSIAAVAGILERYPDTLATIEGHTDSSGSESSNQRLSERRARRVFDLLVQNGVHALRLTMRGYGARVPVADNSTPAGRKANRRVQIKIRPAGTPRIRQGQGG